MGANARTLAGSTPVIGGGCKLGTQDVQIGGKQTQFYLKCEANSESPTGDGIWVVKSKNAQNQPHVELQQHPKKSMKKPTMPEICEPDPTAREGMPCSNSDSCLQSNYAEPGSYLHCDANSQRWVKKHCQGGFVFSFEHQSCIGHSKAATFRQYIGRQSPAGGLVCSYSQCSPTNPCSIGTCNNGYCCSAAPAAFPAFADTPLTNASNTPNHTSTAFWADDWPGGPSYSPSYSPMIFGEGMPQKLTASGLEHLLVKAPGDGSSCAAGFVSSVRCGNFGNCPPGLFCDPHGRLCCPMLLPVSQVRNSRRNGHHRRPTPNGFQRQLPSMMRTMAPHNYKKRRPMSSLGCGSSCGMSESEKAFRYSSLGSQPASGMGYSSRAYDPSVDYSSPQVGYAPMVSAALASPSIPSFPPPSQECDETGVDCPSGYKPCCNRQQLTKHTVNSVGTLRSIHRELLQLRRNVFSWNLLSAFRSSVE
ncbi:Protein K04H4.2 a [Aphelenchoides avenae]|nr:Protein K04H4.2 a [Aphelenchus avenae]